MWDGFGRKARGKVLSGLRGAGFRDGEGAEKQKRRFWKKEKEIGIALAIAAGILVTAGGGYAAVHAKRTGAIKNQEMVKDSEVETLTTLEASSGIIGEGAFSGNLNLKNIKVPEGVTSIGAGAFAGCLKLESIQLPESLTSMGAGVFAGCCNLESIQLPEGVTSIGDDAFYECYSLESIQLPEGVTSIGVGAFSYCVSLESIQVPEGVTSIGAGAFSSCVNLESIQLPESLEDIGYGLFPESDNFEVIMTQEQKNKWDNRDYWDSDFARGSRGSSAASFEEFLFGSWYNQNGDKNYRITIR